MHHPWHACHSWFAVGLSLQIQKPRGCHPGKKENELYKNKFSKKDPQKEWWVKPILSPVMAADIKTSWGHDENLLWLPGWCCWLHGLFCHSKALVASNLNYVYCMYSQTLEASDEEANYSQDPSSNEVEDSSWSVKDPLLDWNCWALHKSWQGHQHCKGKIHKSVRVSMLQTTVPWQWRLEPVNRADCACLSLAAAKDKGALCGRPVPSQSPLGKTAWL